MANQEPLKNGLFAQRTSDAILISGKTYDNRDSLKALGAKWDPNQKVWVLPLTADLTSLKPPPPSVSHIRVYQPNMWIYDRLRDKRRSKCCSQCKTKFDDYNPQGPMWFVCPVHGTWKSDYTGD